MEILAASSPIEYEDALRLMEARVEAIHKTGADDLLWLLEHPPLYTAGTSARPEDLLHQNFPVFQAGRGGQYTYHGPGQRVGYLMIHLKKRQQVPDIKKYVWQLEEWVIRALAGFGVTGERRDNRVGIWVVTPKGEAKIAAIGVRVRHWIAFHGISVNLSPDLSHFSGIVPCGIAEYGVTSLHDLGVNISMEMLDKALIAAWYQVFGDGVAGDAVRLSI